MAEQIKLDILTPLGPKRDGIEVGGVEIPGIEGELGVLPQHEALVTAVLPGVVRFREGPSRRGSPWGPASSRSRRPAAS